MDLIDLYEGKVVSKRWVIDEKLGEGSCATVYKVHDMNDTRVKAALKVCQINPFIVFQGTIAYVLYYFSLNSLLSDINYDFKPVN